MGVNSPELNLDLSTFHVPKTISEFLMELSVIDDISEKSLRVNNYVHMLEDEMRKIEGFKRELPLCMLLLNDAIMRLKEETMQCKKRDVRPIMEEFLSPKGNSDEDGRAKMSTDCSDKKNWMSAAQLWSTNINCVKRKDLDLKLGDEEEDCCAIKNSFQLCSSIGNRGGAFVPFREQPGLAIKEENEVLRILGGSIPTPVAEMGFIDLNLEGNTKIGCASSLFTEQMKSQRKSQPPQQQKKQRRCWSPELHRLFVNALQQLGGAQVATPKQIRELMQVDGLTNDEVKSHLQKYRIHIHMLTASSAAQSNGSWLARDQYGEVSMANIGHSGSPQGHLHMSGCGKWVSTTGCDSMEEEEEEEEKSESHC